MNQSGIDGMVKALTEALCLSQGEISTARRVLELFWEDKVAVVWSASDVRSLIVNYELDPAGKLTDQDCCLILHEVFWATNGDITRDMLRRKISEAIARK